MTNYEIRKDFPIFDGDKIAYLDSGATTQRPKQVIDAVDNFYRTANANPHRGAYDLSIKATDIYEGIGRGIINIPDSMLRKDIEIVVYFMPGDGEEKEYTLTVRADPIGAGEVTGGLRGER